MRALPLLHRARSSSRESMMVAYASRTGTRRNLAALRAAGWRLMVSATGVLRHEGFPYALDNGAWTAHQAGKPFNGEAFRKALALLGGDADFAVLPDVVAGGWRSLDLSASWHAETARSCPRVYLPVQNGLEPSDLSGFLSSIAGIFVGGTTEWKLRTMPQWATLAHERGIKCHVGRVNTRRRIIAAQLAGADSFDGSSVTRFANTLPLLEGTRRQRTINLNSQETP